MAIDNMAGKNHFKEDCQKLIELYKRENRQIEISKALEQLKKEYSEKVPSIPKDLCYLEGEDRDKYLHDMRLCQEFAIKNRAKIAKIICENMEWQEQNRFETVHNYISFKDNIIRKGAISAYKGQKVIIPMNMRDGCLIAIGKGNEDWNQSAPHGAGRVMSRAAARKNLNIEDYVNSMAGIYSTTINTSTIDEAPAAYKPMQEIIDNIQDTVEIVNIIKPIYNFKAEE